MRANLHIEPYNAASQDSIQQGILRALLYFDIFNYPLTANEVIQYCSVKLYDLDDINKPLEFLTNQLLIYKFGDYYSLHNDIAHVERRKQGNKAATDILPKAYKRSLLINSFPFVKSVNISGSLSKNYFDAQSDFDFFVITDANRLWICRLLLTIYKKVFLLNSRKYFCINYYLATNELTIPDKNIFSAIEIITLKNQCGESAFRSFMEANIWVYDYFPNFKPDYSFLEKDVNVKVKRGVERCLSGSFGNKIDHIAFSITTYFLKRKYKHLKTEEYQLNLRSKKHASKHHPQGFQFKVLKAFEQKCAAFEIQHSLKLD